ncbi:hypothetical protein R80B4_00956 [Fibrobacteres bacterium R8-0-B4]
MNPKDTAERVDAALTRLRRQQEETLGQIENVVKSWMTDAAPIIAVLKSHFIPFKNQYVEGQTLNGVIVGKDGDDKLLVLDGEKVYRVNALTDAIDSAEPMELKMFIGKFSLQELKAGFDFVRGAENKVVLPLQDKVQYLLDFYREANKVR